MTQNKIKMVRAVVMLLGAALAFFAGDMVDMAEVQRALEFLGVGAGMSQLFPRIGDRS